MSVEALHRQDLTHQDGSFRITNLPPGRHEVVVERIGYRSARQPTDVPSGGVSAMQFRLSVSAVSVSPFIVVTGALTRRAGEEVLSPTAVIPGAELDRRACRLTF